MLLYVVRSFIYYMLAWSSNIESKSSCVVAFWIFGHHFYETELLYVNTFAFSIILGICQDIVVHFSFCNFVYIESWCISSFVWLLFWWQFWNNWFHQKVKSKFRVTFLSRMNLSSCAAYTCGFSLIWSREHSFHECTVMCCVFTGVSENILRVGRLNVDSPSRKITWDIIFAI